MRNRLFYTISLILLFAIPLMADEQQNKEEEPSYQVTVTADRLEESIQEKTDSITVISKDEIDQNQWRFVIDALRQVPGISIVQTGSPGKVTSVFIRGGGAAQVLVMLDGVPINNPYFGGVNLEDIPTSAVERIEVLRGPQSPLYGSESISGVINIISRKGNGETSFQGFFEGGSFDTFRESVSLQGGQGKADYSVSFLRQDSDGQFENDGYAENAFIASGGYRLNDRIRLIFNGQVYDSEIGTPFHTVFDSNFHPVLEASPLQRQEATTSLVAAGVEHLTGELLNLHARFSYVYRDFLFQDPGSFFADSTNTSDVFQLTFQNDFQLSSENILSVGYEFEHQNIDAQDNLNGPYPLTDIDDHGLFVQNKWQSGAWIVTGGLRYDHYNTFGDTVNPRISVGYRIQKAVKIRGNFGTGFRAPSAGDLGLPFYGNPDLKPEKSKSFEAGIDYYSSMNGVVSFTWFHNDYDDLITADPNTFIAANIDEASAHGFELSTTWNQGPWILGAAYTFLDTEDEIKQLPLPRRPRHSGSFRVGYSVEKWSANLSLSAVGERFENDFLQVPSANVFNPGYSKLDIAGHYQFTQWLKIKGRVENLTDKHYEEVLHYPSLGRGFYGGIEVGL